MKLHLATNVFSHITETSKFRKVVQAIWTMLMCKQLLLLFKNDIFLGILWIWIVMHSLA